MIASVTIAFLMLAQDAPNDPGPPPVLPRTMSVASVVGSETIYDCHGQAVAVELVQNEHGVAFSAFEAGGLTMTADQLRRASSWMVDLAGSTSQRLYCSGSAQVVIRVVGPSRTVVGRSLERGLVWDRGRIFRLPPADAVTPTAAQQHGESY